MKVLEIAMKIPSIPMVPKSDGDRSRASNKPNRKFTIWVENFSIAVHLTPDMVSDLMLPIKVIYAQQAIYILYLASIKTNKPDSLCMQVSA